MRQRIYNLNDVGDHSTLETFEEEPFASEATLQKLIEDHPELLAGEQIDPADPPRFVLVSREAGIAQEVDGAATWSIDHVLIDQHAVPTLVEVKRSQNREIRRTVIGQLLEYAAHASKTWTSEEIRERLESSQDADERLSELLADETDDVEEFWERFKTNLAAKNLRLLFVADEIPDALATVVEFLNAQMPNTEVLAVEVKQFRGGTGLILVPRVIGRTTAGALRKAPSRQRLTRASFLEGFPSASGRDAAQELLRVAHEVGARIDYGDTSVSIRMHCELWPYRQPVTVAWLHPRPEQLGWNNLRDFAFGWAPGHYEIDADSPLKHRLDQWSAEFVNVPYANRVASNDLDAWWISHGDAAENIDLIKAHLAAALGDLADL